MSPRRESWQRAERDTRSGLTRSMDSLLEDELSLQLELSDARLGVFFSSFLVFLPFFVFSCSSSSLLSSLIWHLAAEGRQVSKVKAHSVQRPLGTGLTRVQLFSPLG